MWAYIVAATRRERRRSLPVRESSSDVFTLDYGSSANHISGYPYPYSQHANHHSIYPSSSGRNSQFSRSFNTNSNYVSKTPHTIPDPYNNTPSSSRLEESTKKFLNASRIENDAYRNDLKTSNRKQLSQNNNRQSDSTRLQVNSFKKTKSSNVTPRRRSPKFTSDKEKGRSVPNLNDENILRDLRWRGFKDDSVSTSNEDSKYNIDEYDDEWNPNVISTQPFSRKSSVQDDETNIDQTLEARRSQRNGVFGNESNLEDPLEVIETCARPPRTFGAWIRRLLGRRSKRRSLGEDKFLNKFSAGHGNGNRPNNHTTDDEVKTEKWTDKLIIDTSMTYHYRWLAVVSVAVLYNLIFVIGRSVFWELNNLLPGLWWTLDYTCDAVYFVDMLVHAHEGYLEHGLMVRSVAKLRLYYLRSVAFRWDLLALFPTDFSYIWWSPWPCLAYVPCAIIVRANRIFKLPRMWEWFDRTETATGYPNAFRICKVVLAILVLIHWNACLYFAISYFLGFGSDNWVYNFKGNSTLARQYIYSFYWSTLTLTTIGETPQPENDAEYLFVVADFLAGVLIFATIVGNIGSMISNMNLARVEFQNRMDGVKQYMAFRKVGGELEARVIRWFAYTWAQSGALDEERVLAALPDKLKAEIAIRVHLDTLRQVRIFQDCEPGLLEALVLKLRLQIFSPGDYICRKGDVGKEMYIVKRGRLTVVGDDGQTVFATLSAGSVFGEVSVLDIAGNRTGNRRTANVRSSGYSDLFCLSKRDLWEALADYPEARATLTERGCQILRKDGLLDEEVFRGAELGRESLDCRVARLQVLMETVSTRVARLSAEITASQAKIKQRLNRVEIRNIEPPNGESGETQTIVMRHNYSV